MPTDDIQRILALLDDGNLSDEERANYSAKLMQMQANGEAANRLNAEFSPFASELVKAIQSPPLEAESRSNQECQIKTAVMQRMLDETSEVTGTATSKFAQTLVAGPNVWEETARTDLTGQTIGEYRIIRRINHGGMGMVYEAEDIKLCRRIAFKTMLPKVAGSASNRVRFLREAQAAAKVEHDNICPIYRVGEYEQLLFIAMPFLQGHSLDRILKQETLSLDEAVSIAIEVAAGLSVAHAAGLVHRDIKPANIWIETRADAPRRARILDFGLARTDVEDNQLTHTGMIVGTPSYMAPEQARGESVDGRADLFALGAILYEMLTGKRAFTGDNTVSVLTSLAVETPPPPSEVNASVPPPLSELVMQLLAKRPDQRPGSAQEVVNRLSILRSSLRAKPLPQPVPPKHWLPTAIATGAIFLLFASVFWLRTAEGELKVEFDDSADLRIRSGVLEIYDDSGNLRYRVRPGKPDQKIAAGKYHLKVTGADGLQLDTNQLEIEKGGQVTVRVTAVPPDTAGPIESSPPVIQTIDDRDGDDNLFTGQLIIKELFDGEPRYVRPLVEHATTSVIQSGRMAVFKTATKPQDSFAINFGISPEAGAIAIRCRVQNGHAFLNFCVHRDATRFRWLALSASNPRWRLTEPGSDLIDGNWKLRRPVEVASDNSAELKLMDGEWIDIAARWSPTEYDTWINGHHLSGGPLPDPELAIPAGGNLQICLIAAETGTARIELEHLRVWTQNGVAPDQLAPKSLEPRPKP